MRFLQRILAKTQCAGQHCTERWECARYELREQGAPWASLDLERQRVGGPCIHRAPLVNRKVA